MTTTPAPVQHSVFQRLEPLLAQVSKPIQYVGGEHNSVVKDWDDVAVRWCLSYPDAYEVGQPNQGVAILYEILNERDWILAERTYSIWPDLENLLRANGIPQFTLDGHRPVGLFDVLGVSFSTELGYTNLLNLIDLSGLTFAPEGGSERMRQVINKMVTEDDLINTVAAAFSSGWRQVKLYFMCGLPTETDEDVLAIATLATRVIETGRKAAGTRDIRCTVSIGGFVPKPHTPFQWAAQADAETIDRRLMLLKDAIREDRNYGKAIGLRYHDGKPGIIEGLLSRGDRRVGRVIERVWREGGKFDGWSEHFSYERWTAAAADELAAFGVDLDWFTTRERGYEEVLPWDHLDAGLDRDWLWEDWQDAVDEREVEDCRWTPCYDCGVCPEMNTEIQIGPTGRQLLPLTVAKVDLASR